MDFYKVLKYVLMAVFAAIVVVGVLMAPDQSTNSQTNVPQTGSKFNF
jgi:branched-subunit amino acid transport protein